ncbi:OmpH family outer membrane protein [Aestuariicella sp. G3-2]|uniref:OmpH family outer membrane protein n=1 Tax=Pseudomaricurvus albidus TaxID=2842452 RepID=UPI001C0BDE3C|nr:OmpH family outer membrane protein [Aestuariicella albida]MBU3069173.1 OmpH family outer membrane protein [Aestuariicella albida]
MILTTNGWVRRLLLTCLLFTSIPAYAATEAELQKRIQQLQAELQAANTELKAVQAQNKTLTESNAKLSKADAPIQIGNLKIGGAIRANYTVGDYPASGGGGASRAWEEDGNFNLDTFRVNLDYSNGPYSAKLEYRWYNGYNFLHTGWVGYTFEDDSQLQVGVNRVPFGPGAYGVSQSWLFDQHYYLGLSDDMDLGVKYTMTSGNWTWDMAYYFSDEGQYTGATRDSARYSYDIVNESGDGYEERNQFNLRGIYSLAASEGGMSTDLGFSVQVGELESEGPQSDGDHYAASVHMINQWGNLKLASQVTRYEYDVDDDQPLGTDTLVQYGAYDFPSTAAAEGWVPAISLSYTYATDNIDWLDYVVPYMEYSSIVKDESDFNDSEMFIIGLALARNGWYIYNDLAFSNGNEFVGGDSAFGDRLGANADDEWITRYNINFGYYF